MSQDGVTTRENRSLFQAGAAARHFAFGDEARAGDSNLTVHRYPMDVGERDKPHYVMFFISKRAGDIGNAEVVNESLQAPEISNVNRGVLTGNSAAVYAGLTTTIGLTLLGTKLGTQLTAGPAEIVSNAPDPRAQAAAAAVAATGKLVGGLSGAAVGVAATLGIDVFKNRDLTTLKECIALYLTGTPSTSYKAIWQDKEIGVLGGIAQGIADVAGQTAEGVAQFNIGKLVQAAKTALAGTASAAIATGLANAPKVEGLGDFGALAQASTGRAVNPFRTQLFQNMGFRTFSFTYNFLPKDDAEYRQVKNIIKAFKKYMHPTLSEDKIIMGYPAEFSIAYYYGSGENSELFKIGNCALTDMQVNYGGTDFITFKGMNGAPSEMSIQLQFTELEILTEKRIEEGY